MFEVISSLINSTFLRIKVDELELHATGCRTKKIYGKNECFALGLTRFSMRSNEWKSQKSLISSDFIFRIVNDIGFTRKVPKD